MCALEPPMFVDIMNVVLVVGGQVGGANGNNEHMMVLGVERNVEEIKDSHEEEDIIKEVDLEDIFIGRTSEERKWIRKLKLMTQISISVRIQMRKKGMTVAPYIGLW